MGHGERRRLRARSLSRPQLAPACVSARARSRHRERGGTPRASRRAVSRRLLRRRAAPRPPLHLPPRPGVRGRGGRWLPPRDVSHRLLRTPEHRTRPEAGRHLRWSAFRQLDGPADRARGSTESSSLRVWRRAPRSLLGVANLCRVLLDDPDLASGLDDRRLQRAEQECIAVELVVDVGVWRPRTPKVRRRAGASACSSSTGCSCAGSAPRVVTEPSCWAPATCCARGNTTAKTPRCPSRRPSA
jgi:hypothetical protein